MTDTVLVTCPPMLGLIDEFAEEFRGHGLNFEAAPVIQVMTEEELIEVVPNYAGWIIGDDPATEQVIRAGHAGKLRAAVKWGVGVDNVDFKTLEALKIPVTNTPSVFGNEVADVALTYTLGLARHTYEIDRAIRRDKTWPKPSGISITGRTVGIVGFGDIGRQTARRLLACGANIIAYDPFYTPEAGLETTAAQWPSRLDECDFLVFTAPLNDQTLGMFNSEVLPLLKPGVRIVNVGRGPLIEETALIQGLNEGVVHSAALDVFEVEPLSENSPLRSFERCILGSHNGSNSVDAVRRVSRLAIQTIAKFLRETSE